MTKSVNNRVLRPLCFAALLLSCAPFARGQTSLPPMNVAANNAPAGQPAPAGAPEMVTLQYPNSDVVDVLRLYEQLTGKKLVLDNFVQGKVNIFIAKPVPREEAIRIIEINLLLNGYSLVPAEGDIVKVIGTGKNPRAAGVPIISDESMIPAGDHVISFLFKLRFADPTELQQVLGQYLSPPQPYTSFLALPKSSSILVTENSSVIRSLVNIINQVDIPPAEVVSEFIKLERADASKVVDMLKDVFEKGNQQNGAAPAPGAIRSVRPAVAPAPQQPVAFEGNDIGGLTALSEDSIVVGKIKIAADVRTNRIHVITRPVNMPFVRKLIAEFDANVDFAKPVTRPLRYVSASDVLPVLVQALTEPGGNQQGGAEAGGGANPNNLGQNQNRRNLSNSASTASDFGNNSSGFGGGGGGGQSFSEELSTQAVDTTPKAVTIGNAKIIADQRANTIVILGNREVVVKVMKILDEMDVSAPQVALSTVIGELTLNNEDDLGIDYFLRGNDGNKRGALIAPNGGAAVGATTTNSDGSTSTASSISGIFNPVAGQNFAQLASAATSGVNVYLAAGDRLASTIHALTVSKRFKTISRPTIFTSNNKKAIIASGQEIPVPVSTISTGVSSTVNGLAQQSNIQFKKVALQLEVVPLINSEKEVTLDILQKLDSLTGASTSVDGNNIPTIATRYIKTTVSAPNCSTIVLGGLIIDDKNVTKTGIPLLSKIPVIGGLFRNTTKMKDRQELIVMMRPEVSLTKTDVARLRAKNSDRMHFGPEIDQDDCPNCPKDADGKSLPMPDLPPAQDK